MAVSVKGKKSSSESGFGGFLHDLGNAFTQGALGGKGIALKGTGAINTPKPSQHVQSGTVKHTPVTLLAGGNEKMAAATGTPPGFINPDPAPAEPDITDPNSYLAQAYSMLGQGQQAPSVDELMKGVTPGSFGDFGYGGLIKTTQDQGAQNQAQVQGLYGNLAKQILGQAGVVAQPYNAGISDVNSRGKTTASDINSAYTNAQNQQTAQLAALGIGDAAKIIQGNHQDLASQSAADQSDAYKEAQIIANQLGAGKTSALNYNTGLSQATQRTGVDDANMIAQNVAKQVAQYQQAETQAQQQAYNAARQQAQTIASQAVKQPSLSDALDLAQYLQNQDPNSLAAYQKAQDAQATQDAATQKAEAAQQQTDVSELLKLMSQNVGTSSAPKYLTLDQAQQVVSGAKKATKPKS